MPKLKVTGTQNIPRGDICSSGSIDKHESRFGLARERATLGWSKGFDLNSRANVARASGMIVLGALAISLLCSCDWDHSEVVSGSGTFINSGTGGNTGTPPSSPTYSLGGQVSSLAQGTSITLLDNGANALTVSADGAFTFPLALPTGTAFSVTVGKQPAGQQCSVSGGAGTIAQADVANVLVTCGPLAQAWTWLGGSDAPDATTVFGRRGVAAATNAPGARKGGGVWTDSKGNLWLLGGENSNLQFANDLWLFDRSTRQWTWIGGSSSPFAAGVYGTQGIASTGAYPGARVFFSYWTDAAGKFWLFGGYGYDATGNPGQLNDLWVFDSSNMTWMWVSGSQTLQPGGTYGAIGVPAASNAPGPRTSATVWVDSAGSFWLFGGGGYGAAAYQYGELNDLWRFDPGPGLWTWMSGSSGANQITTAGLQGVPSPWNSPSSRLSASGWVDVAGNLWLFGGFGWSLRIDGVYAMPGDLNDLWQYSPVNGTWTWVNGSLSADAAAVYGTQGTASGLNIPGARSSTVSWVDFSGRFWLYGGAEREDCGCGYSSALADLWMFDPQSSLWTWMGGTQSVNASPVYGTVGVAALSNSPGARLLSMSTRDQSGITWVFGSGASKGFLNDVWIYNP